MNRKVAIYIVRVLGTFAGLLGATTGLLGATTMLFSAGHSAFVRPDAELSMMFLLVFAGVNLLIGLFCIWITYLTWFRFSPRAVQQTCGLLGFIMIGIVMTCFPVTNEPNAGSRPLIYLGAILAALVGYRLLSRYLNNVIFREQSSSFDQSAMR